MTESTLEDRVVAFITERGGGASFVELEREFPEEFDGQEYAMSLTDYENIMLWQPVSQALAGALDSAMNSGCIVMKPAPELEYFLDGKVFKTPTARKLRHYKRPRWLPVTFSPAQAETTTSLSLSGRRPGRSPPEADFQVKSSQGSS